MSNTRKRSPAAPVSQRERLMRRRLPSASHRLLIDPERAEQARQALVKARTEARAARRKEDADPAQLRKLDKAVDAAEAELDACFEVLRLVAIPAKELEDLAGEHPPTKEQMAKAKQERDRAKQRGEPLPDWPEFNEDTYWPALLARCIEGDMTAEDWREMLAGRLSAGEVRALKNALVDINYEERSADPLVLPKGLTQIISSRLS